MTYRELDINARINLKGTYEAFLRIAVEKFKKAQDARLYKTRSRGKNKLTRTRYLYNNFTTGLSMYGVRDVLTINFPLYGRFVDMGVGRGTNVNAAQLRKTYRIHRHDVPRQPRRWYAKTKTSQEKKLAEVLSKRYSIGLVNLAENLLTQTISI